MLHGVIFCFALQSLGDRLVPCLHRVVWLVWETFLGQHLWEYAAGLWIHHIELLNCILQERYMVLGT